MSPEITVASRLRTCSPRTSFQLSRASLLGVSLTFPYRLLSSAFLARSPMALILSLYQHTAHIALYAGIKDKDESNTDVSTEVNPRLTKFGPWKSCPLSVCHPQPVPRIGLLGSTAVIDLCKAICVIKATTSDESGASTRSH